MLTPAVAFVLITVLGQTSAGTNIALGGKVAQSSVGWNGVPGRAIDGNRDSIYGHNSCSHTNHDPNPWWRLDLLKMYKINTVTITNRKDCCHQRINGAQIRIGNSPDINGQGCAIIPSIAPGASATFKCNGLDGRYVTIVIPGRHEYLTLCEVEVTGQPSGDTTPTDPNNALGGKVAQSSVGWNGVPGRAIDGNRDSIYGHNSCSHTNHDKNPWWRLDVLKTHKINTVTITNRKDCCHQRLNGAEIRIGYSPDVNTGSRCAVIPSIAPGDSTTFACKGLVGRYVSILIPGRQEYLTLCEVEVTGQPSGETPPNGPNIALGGKVTQSSVGWNGVPGRAIDGNHDSIYGYNSCSHTNHDQNPWWRLDLLKTYKINTVTVTNRRDCCHQRITGAEIRIGNSPDVNAGSRCAVILSIAPGASATFECKGLVGRYVSIVIPGRREYLTLCEVEVNGIESDESDESDESNEYTCG